MSGRTKRKGRQLPLYAYHAHIATSDYSRGAERTLGTQVARREDNIEFRLTSRIRQDKTTDITHGGTRGYVGAGWSNRQLGSLGLDNEDNFICTHLVD